LAAPDKKVWIFKLENDDSNLIFYKVVSHESVCVSSGSVLLNSAGGVEI